MQNVTAYLQCNPFISKIVLSEFRKSYFLALSQNKTKGGKTLHPTTASEHTILRGKDGEQMRL